MISSYPKRALAPQVLQLWSSYSFDGEPCESTTEQTDGVGIFDCEDQTQV